MSIFKKRALRRNRFSKVVRFIISLAVVFNISSLWSIFPLQVAMAASGAPATVSATYNPNTNLLNVSGSHIRSDGWPGCIDNVVGFAVFINSETPETASLDELAHILPGDCATSGVFEDVHTVVAAPEKVCVAIYDVEKEKIGESGDYSDVAAGSDRNKDNSYDNTDPVFPEGSCTAPTIIDDVAPVLTVPSDMVVAATSSAGVPVAYTATAVDAVDGPITPVCGPIASGSAFPIGVTTVSCSAADTAGNIATGSFNVTVTSAPAISVEKTSNDTNVAPGDSFKYKIHVANAGTGAATGVTVSDNVPDSLKIDGVGCSVSGGATCNITSTANPVQVTGDLPADSFFDVFVDVTVKSDAAVGTVKNTTTVTHSGSGFSGSFSDSGLSITALPVVQPVNAKPVANAHGPYEAVLKDGKAEVSLVGTGTDTDGSIVKYEWDFEGDGIFDLAILASPTVTNGSVSHIYTKAGAYNPVLRVTDDKGATATDTTKAMILSHGAAVLFDVGPDGLTIAADGQLALFATATDSLGNSWDATADTVFAANDPCGMISQSVYLPCQAGEWEIQAAYQALTDKINVKVVAGELNRLEISPYAKPFKIQENKSQVFTVKGFDSDNNEVTILDPEWSTTGEKVAIGKIDQNGKFLATHGGIGRVTAKAGELSASVGIIVKEVKAAAPAKKKIAPVATGGTGGDEPVSDQAGEPAESDLSEEEPVVSSEETKPAENDEEANGTVAGEEEQACTTLPWWVWYLLAAFYAIFLIIYYMNLRRLDKEHGMVRNWWAIPLLLTGVILGIYFLYRCPGVFLRWPWAMILIGVIISAIYYQSREPEDLPPVGPMSNDENIKTI